MLAASAFLVDRKKAGNKMGGFGLIPLEKISPAAFIGA